MQVHQEIYKGFTVTTHAYDDLLEPEWSMSKIEREIFWAQIESGENKWFCVNMTASLDDIVLSSVFRGGCWTRTYIEWLTYRDYADMCQTVVNQACEKIRELYQRVEGTT